MEVIFSLLIILYAIILHEVMHGFVAYKLGDPTAKYEGRLTLNPFLHIDPLGTIILPLIGYFTAGFIFGWAKPVPYNPFYLRNPRRDSILIALAGPLTNIVLAIFFAFAYKFLFLLSPEIFLSFEKILLFGLQINLILAIFNLVPIPPLDGSKLLLAKIPLEIYQYFEIYGFFFIILFIIFFLPYLLMIVNYLQGLLLSF